MSSIILFDVATLFCLHFHFPQKESLRLGLTSRKFILGSDSENQSEGTSDREAEKRKSITELPTSVGNFSSIIRTPLRPWVSVPKYDGEALSTSSHPLLLMGCPSHLCLGISRFAQKQDEQCMSHSHPPSTPQARRHAAIPGPPDCWHSKGQSKGEVRH